MIYIHIFMKIDLHHCFFFFFFDFFFTIKSTFFGLTPSQTWNFVVLLGSPHPLRGVSISFFLCKFHLAPEIPRKSTTSAKPFPPLAAP